MGCWEFIFGIPHAREGEHGTNKLSRDDQPVKKTGFNNESGTIGYRPNTSLEQISDWLTKIIVGVGLVENKQIPPTLGHFSAYLSKGLPFGDSSEAFVFTILIYFSVCGFIFWFLWAHIYLTRWLTQEDRDAVKRLDSKFNQLEARHLADAKALSLVTQQLNRGAEEVAVSDDEIAQVIREASTPIKIQIFDLAQRESLNFAAPDYDLRNQVVTSVFKGLIESDPGGRFHRNHSELSYALSRAKPSNLQEAEKNISIAIGRRNRLGNEGWKYYELRRARYRIQQNSAFASGRASDEWDQSLIMSDLRIAFRDTTKWRR